MAVRVVLLLAVVCATGCRMHDVTREPPPPGGVPAAFRGAGGGEAAPDRWWTAFGDGDLDALVARAIGGNFQVAAAWARLGQGRAFVTIARSPRLPELTASASAGRQKQRITFIENPATGEPLESELNTFAASVGAAYELDLWGRYAAGHDAARLDAAALRDDVEAIATTVAAGVTEAWLDVRFQRARKKLLAEQLAINVASLEVLEARFREGLGTSLDVFQQRSLVAGTRAQIVATDAQLVVLEGQLATLLGTTVDAVAPALGAAPDTLPEPPPVPAVGVPASLLERRPDVRAARRRLEAADHRITVAIADRLPALRLQGSVGNNGTEVGDLIAAPVYALLASVTAPLFDYGRRKAEVSRTRAVVRERVAAYGEAMIRAMVEVEVALGQEQHQQQAIAELLEQARLAAETVRAARDAYREGQIDYLPVLQATQGEQQVALAILQARRQLLSLRVTLYRALGGTWTAALEETRP